MSVSERQTFADQTNAYHRLVDVSTNTTHAYLPTLIDVDVKLRDYALNAYHTLIRTVAAIVKNRTILDISYQSILKNYHFRQYLFWCAARLDNEKLSTIVTSSFSTIPRYFLHSVYIGVS